jgi:hypothetical protein
MKIRCQGKTHTENGLIYCKSFATRFYIKKSGKPYALCWNCKVAVNSPESLRGISKEECLAAQVINS